MTSTSALSSASFAGPLQGESDVKPSVALQDKLARCIQQLGDWQACPSSKTPEGKQIIQNLQTQIRSIESRIAGASKAAAPKPSAELSTQGQAQVGNILRAMGLNSFGSLVDVFA